MDAALNVDILEIQKRVRYFCISLLIACLVSISFFVLYNAIDGILATNAVGYTETPVSVKQNEAVDVGVMQWSSDSSWTRTWID